MIRAWKERWTERMEECGRTEDEFLGRGEHVEGEGDFVLVAFALEPAEEGVSSQHYGGS